MHDALRRAAAATPDKRAACMADGGATTTYATLDARADRMAALFQRLGIVEGGTVAMLHDNHIDVLAWWWGARRAGLYYAPLATGLATDELCYILRDCAAAAVIASASLVETATALRAALADPAVVFLVAGAENGVIDSLDRRLADAVDTPLRRVAQIGRELMYSSGTSGRPKGIRRPLQSATEIAALPALELRMRELFGIDSAAVYLSVAPLYHATGRFLMRTIEEGGTVVILPRFDAEAALSAIERHRVTHTQWVPTMFVRLLALPEDARRRYDLSSMRVALHAAAPCPAPIKRAMINWWGPIVDEYYGGTENAGVTFIPARAWLDRPGSVGRSIAGEIHILDDNGRAVSPGEVGRIFFSNGVPFRYLNAAADVAGPAGLATYGDLGHVDHDGYLYISDRRSDLIIAGGVNIYPSEIERVLDGHRDVAESAVIGVDDAEFGQQVKAIICPRAGAVSGPTLADALVTLCRDRLAAFKCPRSFAIVDALPRNENGKVLKRVLRERYSASVET